MNSCRPSGTRPVKSATNQAISTATYTAMPQIASQIASGIASSRRKKTVRRLRFRSSSTIRPIG